MSKVTALFAMPPQPQPKGFDDFWKVYPRRKDKLDAIKAWRRALNMATAEQLVSCAKKYAAEVAGKEPQFIKLPATWLNKGSFLDEEDPVPVSVDPRESRLQLMASSVKRAEAGNSFAADWVKNNVTDQDREEMKARGLL